MANTPEAPFGPDDLVDLKSNLELLDQAEAMVRKAKQAGIDLGDQPKELEDLRARIMRIKQTFFPGS